MGASLEVKETEKEPHCRRGGVQEPPQKRRQETETIQNIVELTDTGFEGATIEDWSSFISALKVVKVDRTRDVL